MAHDQVGHLGIFVSSQIANREHREVGSTLKTIEALAPGLYEMRIENVEGSGNDRRFTVGFVERTLDDIRKLDDGKEDERPFATVARVSEFQAQAYEMWVRPVLTSLVTETAAEMSRALHPQRLTRALASSRNPLSASIKQLADSVRTDRHKAEAGNPFLTVEKLAFQLAEQAIDFWRDQRDMLFELMFHTVWVRLGCGPSGARMRRGARSRPFPSCR